MKIMIAGGGTGGHLMPALAIADELATTAGVEVVLIGSERGIEASILPERSHRYRLLPFQPIHRERIWRNVAWLLLVSKVLRLTKRLIHEERPSLVVGTGGYVAGPVLFTAHRAGIPIALQEQNAYPGLTTRWLARAAKQIHLGFPEARTRLRADPERVFDTGNPIRPPTDAGREEAKRRLGIPEGKKVLLVTGGSQGSASINAVVAEALETLLADVAVLWSTGSATFEEYRGFDNPPNRQIRSFWDPISEAYSAADLVVGRSGAMSVAEFCAWGLPSILIPLPSAAADHQTGNAKALEAAGAAIHLPQAALTPERLGTAVKELLQSDSQLDEMGCLAARRGRPEAASKIASQLLSIVS